MKALYKEHFFFFFSFYRPFTFDGPPPPAIMSYYVKIHWTDSNQTGSKTFEAF